MASTSGASGCPLGEIGLTGLPAKQEAGRVSSVDGGIEGDMC